MMQKCDVIVRMTTMMRYMLSLVATIEADPNIVNSIDLGNGVFFIDVHMIGTYRAPSVNCLIGLLALNIP